MCPAALTMEQKIERAEVKKSMREEIQETPNQSEQVRSTTDRPSRKSRGSFSGTESKLRVNRTIEGYHLHILNDVPGRLQTAIDNGYEFVTPEEVGGVSSSVVSRNTDIGDKVRYLVGRDDAGGPLYAYLMKQHMDWYLEDQAKIQNKNDMVDDAIRRGTNSKEGYSPDGFYSPKGGIKLQT